MEHLVRTRLTDLTAICDATLLLLNVGQTPATQHSSDREGGGQGWGTRGGSGAGGKTHTKRID